MLAQTNNKNFHLWLAIIASMSLVAGFLYSRALLSISTVLLLSNALLTHRRNITFQRLRTNFFVKACSLYFLIYLISFFWSDNIESFWQVITIKLPFILLPIGILGLPFEQLKFKKILFGSMLLLFMGNMLYSIILFSLNHEAYIEGYAHSKQIPTTVYGDHIRFSLWLSVLLMMIYWNWCNRFWILSESISKKIYIIYAFLIIFFIHLLSAKTGLMTLYIVLVGIAFHIIRRKFNLWLTGIVTIIAGYLLIIFSYMLIPTFRAKVAYMKTQYDMVNNGEALNYNYSDLGRLISYRVTNDAIKRQPLLIGAGAGDISDEMEQSYNRVHPEVPNDSRFVPINQYLVEILAFGLVLSQIFWILIASGIRRRNGKYDMLTVMLTVLMLASMMVEAMLQIQHGIFVYIFLTIIIYYWKEKSTTLSP